VFDSLLLNYRTKGNEEVSTYPESLITEILESSNEGPARKNAIFA